jgi:hypothetical protein
MLHKNKSLPLGDLNDAPFSYSGQVLDRCRCSWSLQSTSLLILLSPELIMPSLVLGESAKVPAVSREIFIRSERQDLAKHHMKQGMLVVENSAHVEHCEESSQMDLPWRLELTKRYFPSSKEVGDGYSLLRDDGARLDLLGGGREKQEDFRYIHGDFKIEFTATMFDAEGLNPSSTYDVWLRSAISRLARNDPSALKQFRQHLDQYKAEITDALLAWSRLRPKPPAVVTCVHFSE